MQKIQVTKRIICNACGYPKSTCLCQWVKPIQSPLNIVILQHPKEVNHAKNTVKLLQLGLTNIQVIQGETSQDFTTFAKKVAKYPQNYTLCYPSESSEAIEPIMLQSDKATIYNQHHSVILIDASWRKALKMWHLNSWLHVIKCWHFSHPPVNQYQIRQTSQTNSLSTLESVAYVLKTIHNTDCKHLLTLFKNMQNKCFIDNNSIFKKS